MNQLATMMKLNQAFSATSQELAAQATTLKEMIDEFEC